MPNLKSRPHRIRRWLGPAVVFGGLLLGRAVVADRLLPLLQSAAPQHPPAGLQGPAYVLAESPAWILGSLPT